MRQKEQRRQNRARDRSQDGNGRVGPVAVAFTRNRDSAIRDRSNLHGHRIKNDLIYQGKPAFLTLTHPFAFDFIR